MPLSFSQLSLTLFMKKYEENMKNYERNMDKLMEKF